MAEAGSQAGVAAPVSARRKAQSRIAWWLVALLAAAIAVLIAVYYPELSTEVRTIRTFVPYPGSPEIDEDVAEWEYVAISPDGRHLVFPVKKSGQERRLWVRSLDALAARPLAGTEGALLPFWSPDSRYVGFFAQDKLKKIRFSGGLVQTLCDAPSARGGTWSKEDVIVFAPEGNGPLFKVAAAGGKPTQVTELDKSGRAQGHRSPHFLPDGRHFLYVTWRLKSEDEAQSIVVLAGSIDSEERKSIVEISSAKVAYASNHLLFLRERTLMAQSFDPDRMELTGDAFAIAEELKADGSRAVYSVSRNGILAYRTREPQVTNLVWYNRSGEQVGVVGEPPGCRTLSLSPDGTTAAAAFRDPETSNLDLWMVNLARGIRTRFTFDDSDDRLAVWSPDATRIVFSSKRRGYYAVFQKRADGEGEVEFVQGLDNGELMCTSWSPDGHNMICDGGARGAKTGRDIFLLSLSEDAELTPLIQADFMQDWAEFSPDGRWIAYLSGDREMEVYVRQFPLKGGKWRVSTAGGTAPRWAPDGKELFYLDPEDTLMAAKFEPGETSPKVGPVESLFQTRVAGRYRG